MTVQHTRRPAGRTGFTLVELMIVVFIIALLTGLTLTIVPKVKRAVQTTATLNQLGIIANAMQQYYGDYKAYPGPLANNQIGTQYDTAATAVSYAYVGSPTTGQLVGTDGNSAGGSSYPIPATGLGGQLGNITEAENAVLGLCGGLRITVSPAGTVAFEYHPEDLVPDGVSPAYKGAVSLNTNPSLARRSQSYLSLKTGDLYVPTAASTGTLLNHGQFTDGFGHHATDSLIPEFLDKYTNQLPILVMRANVGGKAICGIRNADGKQYVDDGGAVLANPNATGYGSTGPIVPQWDLNQILGYTTSTIGTVANKANLNHNGLAGEGNQNLTDTISGGWANNGLNAIAYLKDPNYTVVANSGGATAPTNAAGGTARAADQFLLISAGPDGIYGTPDDVIYPGNTVGGQ